MFEGLAPLPSSFQCFHWTNGCYFVFSPAYISWFVFSLETWRSSLCCVLKFPGHLFWYRSIFIHCGGYLVSPFNFVNSYTLVLGMFLRLFHWWLSSFYALTFLFGALIIWIFNHLNWSSLFSLLSRTFPQLSLLFSQALPPSHLYSSVFNSKCSKCLTWWWLPSNVW